MKLRLSWQGLRILNLLLSGPLAGADVLEWTEMQSGTVYPLLKRMAEEGIVVGRWERRSPKELSRPRRRLYRLTTAGRRYAEQALAEVRS